MPYRGGFPGNFVAGKKLFLTGLLDKDAKKFEINLYNGNDIAFHFNPRLSDKVSGVILGWGLGSEGIALYLWPRFADGRPKQSCRRRLGRRRARRWDAIPKEQAVRYGHP